MAPRLTSTQHRHSSEVPPVRMTAPHTASHGDAHQSLAQKRQYTHEQHSAAPRREEEYQGPSTGAVPKFYHYEDSKSQIRLQI